MRALAAALSILVVLAATTPHLHLLAAGEGGEACAVCLARGGEVATSRTPDLSPVAAPGEEVPPAQVVRPACGAPLGAVPGQSPPRA